MSIFLKHVWLTPNILKWQDYKIFTKLVLLQTPFRSSRRRWSVKKGALKNLWNFTAKHMCSSLFLIKLQVSACNFIKERLQHRFFPMKFKKILRTSILKNICQRLLLTKLNHKVFLWISWRHYFLYNNIINC